MSRLAPFIELIKPKQTTLLMITCAVAYFVAAEHNISAAHFVLSMLAVLLAVAGTTALNMWLDMDIDVLMPRTKNRPLPSGRLAPWACALYGSALFAAGMFFGLMLSISLAAVLALGLLFDILVYTVILKRKSPYSIVLGGVAGAMPSLAGWTAARGAVEPAGIVLSLIVLVWIPAHIWYLSMYFEEDYRLSGVPMLPLVVGMERTSWMIVIGVSTMLVLVGVVFLLLPLGYAYLLTSVLITSYLLYRSVRFALSPSREEARGMYRLASITLGAVFCSMVVGVVV
ncbi:heme o synthase [Methermicoccus shengliensis]|uniref:Protoheme IX farnesyltransferase n=1 Tax=Methermicoccus shengliensis TaxID=660064 RepID=A0A832VXJ5_9EURY|nr:heme o synthase [Methermicoccus shengliensis]KUK03974.1 MAG: Protoheme IX farnesyltransferase [Euryarchaeota archaeon 55_53]KUK29649.1 MAG: Protoheme IX farnesyltransferase [Methanosarcinales archeaon 56_1174]MDI3488651.1 heme o synthase [Methanosarcinales archaeon]MDN5295893.1 heme o synthase [Methanosarcinales archaeon]HIH69902.1 protoheme IX farnesyltransferase [Methermicoccus shengliensis]